MGVSWEAHSVWLHGWCRAVKEAMGFPKASEVARAVAKGSLFGFRVVGSGVQAKAWTEAQTHLRRWEGLRVCCHWEGHGTQGSRVLSQRYFVSRAKLL